MNNIYFDNSATTKTDEEVVKAMLPYFCEYYGNASSIYQIGQESKNAIEEARDKIAKILNCDSSEIYFTAGGSESDNTAIRGIAYSEKNKGKGNHIITSKIEHLAVLDTCRQLEKEGFEVTYLDVTPDGIVDLNELKKSIKDGTILITIMFANNEIGTLQPIKEIGKIAKENGIVFHTDAVQAIGNVKIDVKELNIDSLSLSGHKFYGPKGIGALYVKKGIGFEKFINGGHQEKNKRAGTENVPGIVGMAKAMEMAYEELDEHTKNIRNLRNYLIKELEEKIPNIKINGDLEKRLPGNVNISFEGVDGQALLMNLDLKGIAASIGSACTSGSLDPSYVLLAIGLKPELAQGSLRITLGKYNIKEEVDYLIQVLEEIIPRLRKVNLNWR